MSLPPILYHYFRVPLPYTRTLALQETLHQIQLRLRRTDPVSHPDILLLLQHRPVYTGGRRQTSESLQDESDRLTNIGADFVTTKRGGELTYHGPGQIVGYPLLDLARASPPLGIRDYICRMQVSLQDYLRERHGIRHVQSEHTGVFLDPTTKVASIGVQVRHRLTSHGFAINVTDEPIAWFDRVVACGLEDVRAGSIQGAAHKEVRVEDEIPGLVDAFGKAYKRQMVKMDSGIGDEIAKEISSIEDDARQAGDWLTKPIS